MAVQEREAEVAETGAAEDEPQAGGGRGSWLPHPSGPDGWTARDLASFPDDGLRYELLDGMVIVSPSPAKGHQQGSGVLFVLLWNAAPCDLQVLAAPMDWQAGEARLFQPDILVVPRAPRSAPVADPVLLVEIASPSTATYDRQVKFGAYAEAGVPQYWIVEPGEADDGSDVAVEVYDLVDGAYVLQGRAVGAESLDVTGPVEVRVVPAELAR